MTRLSRRFFATDSPSLARRLLGCRLVRVLEDGTRLAGMIVETEAYLGLEDRAAHSFGGRRTPRNESMYARAGTAYVYFTYGMHHCVNVVCGRIDEPVAVLIRALQPTEGVERMFAHRRGAKRETDLCSGPGKLCQALAIDRSQDGQDLLAGGRLAVEASGRKPIDPSCIINTPRIGIGSAGEWVDAPLRWAIAGNAHVSRGAGRSLESAKSSGGAQRQRPQGPRVRS
ncbi:MAG: DNA-3-methyladenine glycosylase [Phycisphaeraceae bacterium]|nr:DNA-3-methyladenine glycosylase [Phycisphaeraceae bacterium]